MITFLLTFLKSIFQFLPFEGFHEFLVKKNWRWNDRTKSKFLKNEMMLIFLLLCSDLNPIYSTRNSGRYAPLFLGGLRPPGGPSAPTGWASPTLRPTAPVVVKNFQIGAFGPNLEIFHGQTDRQTEYNFIYIEGSRQSKILWRQTTIGTLVQDVLFLMDVKTLPPGYCQIPQKISLKYWLEWIIQWKSPFFIVLWQFN